jgi:molecular chaperone GrpE
LQELLSIFERYKIKRIDPMGEKFDHHFHQAVVQVERPDIPAGTVIQVVQAGYIIHDRLLRPAMVAVSKQGEPTKQVDTNA